MISEEQLKKSVSPLLDDHQEKFEFFDFSGETSILVTSNFSRITVRNFEITPDEQFRTLNTVHTDIEGKITRLQILAEYLLKVTLLEEFLFFGIRDDLTLEKIDQVIDTSIAKKLGKSNIFILSKAISRVNIQVFIWRVDISDKFPQKKTEQIFRFEKIKRYFPIFNNMLILKFKDQPFKIFRVNSPKYEIEEILIEGNQEFQSLRVIKKK